MVGHSTAHDVLNDNAVDDINARLDALARASTVPQRASQPKAASPTVAPVKFIQRLGHGVFGEVWRAEWNGQTVAAKVTGCPTGFRREEVAALRMAQGPHTVKLLGEEPHTTKGTAIIMELCSSSLEQQLAHAKATNVPCSPLEFLERIAEISIGLRSLHEKFLIFGDLKPDNILIGMGGQLLFSDFGDARDMRVSVTGRSVHDLGWGSPNYHARPDVMAMVLTCASDLWMLAQTMIHVWTREPASTNPSAVPTDIPLRQQLLACLNVDREERPTVYQMVYCAHEELQRLHAQPTQLGSTTDAPRSAAVVSQPQQHSHTVSQPQQQALRAAEQAYETEQKASAAEQEKAYGIAQEKARLDTAIAAVKMRLAHDQAAAQSQGDTPAVPQGAPQRQQRDVDTGRVATEVMSRRPRDTPMSAVQERRADGQMLANGRNEAEPAVTARELLTDCVHTEYLREISALKQAVSGLACHNQTLLNQMANTSRAMEAAVLDLSKQVAHELTTKQEQHDYENEYLAAQLEELLADNLMLDQEAAVSQQQQPVEYEALSEQLHEAISENQNLEAEVAMWKEKAKQQQDQVRNQQQQRTRELEVVAHELQDLSAENARLEQECAVLMQFVRQTGIEKEERQEQQLEKAAAMQQQLDQMSDAKLRVERGCSVWVSTAQALESEKEVLQQQLYQAQESEVLLEEVTVEKLRLEQQCVVLMHTVKAKMEEQKVLEDQLARYAQAEIDWRNHSEQLEMELTIRSPQKENHEGSLQKNRMMEEQGRIWLQDQLAATQQLLGQSDFESTNNQMQDQIAYLDSEGCKEETQAQAAAERAQRLDDEISAVKRKLQEQYNIIDYDD